MYFINSTAYILFKSLSIFISVLKYSFFTLLIYHTRLRLLNIAGNPPTATNFSYNVISLRYTQFLSTAYLFL